MGARLKKQMEHLVNRYGIAEAIRVLGRVNALTLQLHEKPISVEDIEQLDQKERVLLGEFFKDCEDQGRGDAQCSGRT